MKPLLSEFKSCEKVLEFILKNLQTNEPYAKGEIAAVEMILENNSFSPADYEE